MPSAIRLNKHCIRPVFGLLRIFNSTFPYYKNTVVFAVITEIILVNIFLDSTTVAGAAQAYCKN